MGYLLYLRLGYTVCQMDGKTSIINLWAVLEVQNAFEDMHIYTDISQWHLSVDLALVVLDICLRF